MFDLSFEWTVLLLRLVFIFLIYFFVYQVARVVSRELRATAGQASLQTSMPMMHGALLIADPGDSDLRRGEVFDLDPVTVIGRHPRATIVIQNNVVSAEHVQVTWENGGWWVTDLRSTNGTFLNGHQIQVPTQMYNGDVIEIGSIKLQLIP